MPETGSRNNLRYIVDRNMISRSETMFLMVAYTMKHRPTVKSKSIYAKRNMVGKKPEVELAYML